MIEAILRLFRTPAPAAESETIVIDQGAYFDALRRRQRDWEESERIADREQERIAYVVWDWTRDVIRYRNKIPLPVKLPRTGVVRVWLDGLHVQEIFALSKSDGWSIRQHLYGNARIAGVRRVQKLPPAALRFPAPRIADDIVGRAAGGGPRR